MDSAELMLGVGKLVEFRGDVYEIGRFDSSCESMLRVVLRPAPRGIGLRWLRGNAVVDQQFFGEIKPYEAVVQR